MNFELVINADFNSDLLDRSSDRFVAMEENIKTAVRQLLNVYLCFPFLAVELKIQQTCTDTHGIQHVRCIKLINM